MDAHPVTTGDSGDHALRTEPPAAPRFALGTLFLGIAWLCVLLALARVAPILSVLLAVISLPALARTCWLNEQLTRRGRRLSPTVNGALFLSSIVVVLVIIATGIATFFAACTAGLFVLIVLADVFPSQAVDVLAMLATVPVLIAAFALAAFAAVRIEKLFRPS